MLQYMHFSNGIHDFVSLTAGYNFLGSSLIVEPSVAGGAKKR
jgi:hypothetical protein